MSRLRCLATVLAATVSASGCTTSDRDVVLVGTVERTLVELAAPISETLNEIDVERGEHVEAGAVVARLDPTLARAEVARAEAGLASARTADLTARHDLVRLTGLRRSNIASQQDLERAQLAAAEAAARLREADAVLAAARHRADELVLRAPVAGTVDQIPFDRGERVPAGGVVVVLLDASAPWVRVWVPEPRVTEVAPGTPARVMIEGIGQPLVGRVLDVAREPEFTPHFALTERDRVHLVFETRVGIVDAPAHLRPGMAADVVLMPPGAEPPP